MKEKFVLSNDEKSESETENDFNSVKQETIHNSVNKELITFFRLIFPSSHLQATASGTEVVKSVRNQLLA